MGILKWAVLVAVVGLFSSTSFAEDKSSGCGLGWMILKKNSLVSSSLRATTNGIFSNSAFGMTSGTSGCAQHDIVKNDSKGIHYAEANYEKLALEMAQGRGEFLDGFAAVMGCDTKVFNKKLQENYFQIYGQEDMTPVDMYSNVKGVILNDFDLAQSCGVVKA